MTRSEGGTTRSEEGTTRPRFACRSSLLSRVVPTSELVVLASFAKANDACGAEKWLSKMKDAGLSPSAVSYNAVIHACARAGDVERAAGWLVAVRRDPTAPEVNVFTWSTVIHACAKAGDADGAEKWLATMAEAGMEANAVTFSSLR